MRRKWRKPKPKKSYNFVANDKINSEKVFLIDDEGEKIGEISRDEAIQKAREAEMDLVLVNPKAEPPVAKISDLGKLKYEQDKKDQKQKSKQKKTEIKSLRLSVRISDHDFNFRLKQAKEFLQKGQKLKLELNLRGRERQHPEKAKETIDKFITELKATPDIDVKEEQPLTKQGGKYIIVLVATN